ncbi:proprotein convertase subtilisin/kexin type 6-like [Rhynchonycteris naso]
MRSLSSRSNDTSQALGLSHLGPGLGLDVGLLHLGVEDGREAEGVEPHPVRQAERPYSTFSSHQSRSRMLELSTPELEPPRAALSPAEVPEDKEDFTAPSSHGSPSTLQTSVCHPECGDKGCDQCLNCVHFSLGSAKTCRKCVSMCPLGYFGDTAARRCCQCHRGCDMLGQGPNPVPVL